MYNKIFGGKRCVQKRSHLLRINYKQVCYIQNLLQHYNHNVSCKTIKPKEITPIKIVNTS